MLARCLSRLCGALLLCLFLPAQAESPRVLVSVKPLQMLAAGVMDGLGEPELLIPAGASPHAYALKPSEWRRLQAPGLVLWVGPVLEGGLGRSLAGLPAAVRVEAVGGWQELDWLPLRAGHGHEDGSAHGGAEDAHFWLDPTRAAAFGRRLAALLAERDPARGPRYLANAEAMALRLKGLQTELDGRLKPVRALPFWVYHDGYQYFEQRFGLSLQGALNQSPEQPLKPAALQRLSADETSRCVLMDSQFRQSQLARLLGEMELRLVELDPFGVRAEASLAGYEAMMRALSEAIAGCLAPR